ncbi:MAG: sulfite exporter TauE/SafE family protein [Caldilineaceae bacterium]|nr:sulfite exporter TauE/SafE family protein [Caldilineaceae bacterium]
MALLLVYLLWTNHMLLANRWYIFADWWPMSLTMVLGSFVAGASAEGGPAVAFPVFTKLLQIPAGEARTFGLMIQSAGMTMASVVILTRRIKVLPGVIGWVSLGGIVGMVVGSLFVQIPLPYPKILFTFVTAAFGVALVLSRWALKWQPHNDFQLDSWPRCLIFATIGLIGGIFAANTGSGIDTLTFIVLTLAFGINEKVSTPTTVVIMGLNSVIGFLVHGVVMQDIGIVWEYWLACVPIVILGAPLGAYVAGKVSRDAIIYLLLGLITLELVTTIILIPFTPAMVIFTWITVAVCAIWFAAMLVYRHRFVKPLVAVEPTQLMNPAATLSVE